MYCKHGKPYITSIEEEETEHLFLLELFIESIITEQSIDRCSIHDKEPPWTAAFWLMDTFSFEIKQEKDAQPEETIFRDSKLRRVKFNAGKSCLFLAKPSKLLSIIRQHPVYVSVQTEPENSIVPDILGRGKIPFDPAMIYDIQESIDSKTPNVECSRAGCYPLYDCGENEVGYIKCFLRLYYYGRNILSEFKLMGGMDDLIFKVDKNEEKHRCCKCGNRLKSMEKGGSSTKERKDQADSMTRNLDNRDVKRDLSWKKVYSCSSKTSPCKNKCSSHHFHEFLLLAKGSEPSEASKPSSTYESLKRMAAHLDLEDFITEIEDDPADIYEKARVDANEGYRRKIPEPKEDDRKCTCGDRMVDILPPRGAQSLEYDDKNTVSDERANNAVEKVFIDEGTDCLGLGEEEVRVIDGQIPEPSNDEKRSSFDANNLRGEEAGPSTSEAPVGKPKGKGRNRGSNKARDPDLAMRRPPRPQAGPSRGRRLPNTGNGKSGQGCTAHKDCLLPYKRVPKDMGWLYTENHDLGRGWKPGTVSSSVVKMMEIQRSDYGRDRGDYLPKGKEVQKPEKVIGQLPNGSGPALRFRMHKGSFLVSLDPAGTGGKVKDKNDKRGLFLRINKKVDEDAYSSSSDLEFEFIAPSEKKENTDLNKKAVPFGFGTMKNPLENTLPSPTEIPQSPKVARPESQKPNILRQNRTKGKIGKESVLEKTETQVNGKDLETTTQAKKEKAVKPGKISDQEPVEKTPEKDTPAKAKNPKKK